MSSGRKRKWASRPIAADARPARAEPVASAGGAAEACAGRVTALELAARDCERKLHTCAQPDPDDGQPIVFPPEVPDAFRQEQLVASLDQAFEEAGIKGEVLVAECDEYPCLACASLGDPASAVDVTALHKEAARLGATAALARYQDAAKIGGTFSARLTGGLERLIFCQGYFPKPGDPADEERIRKRAQARILKMRNAF